MPSYNNHKAIYHSLSWLSHFTKSLFIFLFFSFILDLLYRRECRKVSYYMISHNGSYDRHRKLVHYKKAKLQARIKPTAFCSVINKENSIEFLLNFLYYLYNYYMVCALLSYAYHVIYHVTSWDVMLWLWSCDCDYVTLVTWYFPALPSI